MSEEPRQNKGRELVDRKLVKPPVILLPAVPRRLFGFGSLVVLDVVRGYLLFILLETKTENR